jgi:hypothetical protein
MRRREFIAFCGGAAVTLPRAARAQKSTKMTRVGILSTANPRSTSFFQAFELRLRDLGYMQVKTLHSNTGMLVATLNGCPESLLNWSTSILTSL